jgi:hypothetical protein
MKIKRTVQFLAFFIILAAILTFSSCNDKETYDNVPQELQGQWGEFPSFFSFNVTSWSYTKDALSSVTVSDLTVKSISNYHENKADYPSGYEIMGTVKASSGSFTSTYPKGKYITQEFYLSKDKSSLSVY